MKRILALNASPRNLGNCEIMIKEISRKIEEPHELRLVQLTKYDIRPCTGCYACLFGDKGCVIKDDFAQLEEELLAADAYIIASPTYFLGANSMLKRFIDRGLALYRHAEKLWGRPAIGFGIAGIRDREGYTELGLESFIKLLLGEIKGVATIYGALPGEIFFDDANRDTAARLAGALFGEELADDAPTCSVCGGRTFRFQGGGEVSCMLCSNRGGYTCEGGVFSSAIKQGEHEMFTSLEAAVTHREWLKGMKKKFMAEKHRLKEISVGYLDEENLVKVKPIRDES